MRPALAFALALHGAAGITVGAWPPRASGELTHWHDGVHGTLCQLDPDDVTPDGHGSADLFEAASLGFCKAQCESQALCYGIEYSSGRCEIWTRPVGHIKEGPGGFSCWTVSREAGSWETDGIVFFAILLAQAILNLTVSLPVVWVFTLRRMAALSSWAQACQSCRRVCRLGQICSNDSEPHMSLEAAPVGPEIAAVIPCYLPNEQGIIEDTVLHIMRHLEAPGDLSVYVVYNTPIEMPEVEARLQSLAQSENLPRGRTLVLLRVDESGSKAENLNAALRHIKAPLVAIYDADHNPDSNSLELLYSQMKRNQAHCVQGSTYIRNVAASGLMGVFVDAEFFVVHFMQLPAAQFLTRQGFFGGSNAIWDRHVLQSIEFRPEMQTEDIDISFRALLDLKHIDFCPEARSGELAPVDLRALFYQRLRWAIGWDQVALQQLKVIGFGRVHFSLRCGLIYYLYVRWLLTVAGLCAWIVLPVIHFTGAFDSPGDSEWKVRAAAAQRCLLLVYIVNSCCCLIEAACQAERNGRAWMRVLALVLFFLVSPIYVVGQAAILFISLWKSLSGPVTGWYVSPRSLEFSDGQLGSPRDAVLHGVHHSLAQTPDSAESWNEELQEESARKLVVGNTAVDSRRPLEHGLPNTALDNVLDLGT